MKSKYNSRQFGTVVSAVEREAGVRNCVGSIPGLGS